MQPFFDFMDVLLGRNLGIDTNTLLRFMTYKFTLSCLPELKRMKLTLGFMTFDPRTYSAPPDLPRRYKTKHTTVLESMRASYNFY